MVMVSTYTPWNSNQAKSPSQCWSGTRKTRPRRTDNDRMTAPKIPAVKKDSSSTTHHPTHSHNGHVIAICDWDNSVLPLDDEEKKIISRIKANNLSIMLFIGIRSRKYFSLFVQLLHEQLAQFSHKYIRGRDFTSAQHTLAVI